MDIWKPGKNILVIRHENCQIKYTYFSRRKRGKTLTTLLNTKSENTGEFTYFIDSLRKIRASIMEFTGKDQDEDHVDTVAISSLSGGSEFEETTGISNEVIRKLEKMIPNYPNEFPSLLNLIQCINEIFPDSTPEIIFENAFFSNLNPPGQYGLLHKAAMKKVAFNQNLNPPARLLSVCLEPHPEIVAILNGKPLLVINENLHKGNAFPEAVPFEKPLNCKASELSPVLRNRGFQILKACHLAAETLGQIEFIVFSGYFNSNADYFGPFIVENLGARASERIAWACFDGMRDRLIANAAEKIHPD